MIGKGAIRNGSSANPSPGGFRPRLARSSLLPLARVLDPDHPRLATLEVYKQMRRLGRLSLLLARQVNHAQLGLGELLQKRPRHTRRLFRQVILEIHDAWRGELDLPLRRDI